MKINKFIKRLFNSSRSTTDQIESSHLDNLDLGPQQFSVLDGDKLLDIMDRLPKEDSKDIRFGFNNEVLINRFNKFKLSRELDDFYSKFHFLKSFSINSIIIYSLERLQEENIDYVPSCYTAEIGYVIFGGFGNGDALCVKVDSSETTVYETSHDLIYEDTSNEDIPNMLKPVADSLTQTIELALDEKLY